MIIFDCETTGLLKPDSVMLAEQPFIIEFCAIKVNKKFKETDRLHFMAKPPIKLSKKIIKLTGITDNDLKKEKSFAAYVPDIISFFFAEMTMLAHNIYFDVDCLWHELRRVDKLKHMPWPPVHICTSEASKFINKGKFMKLADLAKEMKINVGDTHRAHDDVELLRMTAKEMFKMDLL